MTIKIQKKFSINPSEIGFIKFLLIILFALIGIRDASAQLNLNGLLQNYLAVQTTGKNEFIASRNRLRFRADKSTDFGGLTTELDLIHTFNKSQNIEFLLKEAYIDWYLEKYDIRIGHQKIIWGRTNGAFVTDIVTPVDLREFLTISAEDIRFGLTAFNTIRYFGANSLHFVVAPFFQKDLLPSAESRWFPASQLKSVFTPIPVSTSSEDTPYSLEDVQLALRYSLLSPNNFDINFLLMRWTHPTPAYDISFNLLNVNEVPSVDFIESYENSWMAGISTSLKLHSNLYFLTESLFVRNKLFNKNPFGEEIEFDLSTDLLSFFEFLQTIQAEAESFLIKKPWIHAMAGVRTELLQTTIDVQFYIEGIFDYEEQILQEEVYKYVTLLGARSFMRDRLQILTLSRYNIDTNDFWIQFQGQYELDDNLQLTLGTNLFGGEKNQTLMGHLSFSKFRQNSFVFSKIALFF